MSRQTSLTEPESQVVLARSEPTEGAGPLGWLPTVSRRQLRLEQRLERWTRTGGLPPALRWLEGEIGTTIVVDRPEILWRASGLARAALVAHLAVPRLATRVAVGIEVALAHTIVDRLLGFDRTFAEKRLQLTPVEWGVWTFLFERVLESLQPDSRPELINGNVGVCDSSPGELSLDRVSPDVFDPESLGPIVTVRWPVRIEGVAAAVRVWLPESIVGYWLCSPAPPVSGRDSPAGQAGATDRFGRVPSGELTCSWRAIAGTVTMPLGLKRLRPGGVLPLDETRLSGTPASLGGPIDLILDIDGQGLRFRMPTYPVADSGGRLLRLQATPGREPRPGAPTVMTQSETKPMSAPEAVSAMPPAPAPLDVPVTLTVEMGRVNVTLSQLADLKAGDVLELNRHSKAAVELTSNGRLVARGELILIDTDLGVRVTGVFL